MSKQVAVSVFLGYLIALLAATVYFQPSWGLMDDAKNLQLIEEMQRSQHPLKVFKDKLREDATQWGIFSPVYRLWVAVVYSLFKGNPLMIYVIMILMNMGSLLVWGLVLYEFFLRQNKDFYTSVFFYPLSFFLFTPFWNIFMYIPLPEKFVVLFSGLSFYFFKKSYDNPERKSYIFYSLISLTAGLLSKPTGIYLPIVYALFSFGNLCLRRFRCHLSATYVLLNSFIAIIYLIFTFNVQLHGRYTAAYKDNLKLGIMLGKILQTPWVLKFLFVMAIGLLLYWLIRDILLKNKQLRFPILLPASLILYLVILSPWGFYSYHFSAFTPFVLGMFFPAYLYLCKRNILLQHLVNSVIIFLLVFVFVGIIVPRISKMGEIAKTVEFLKQRTVEAGDAQYFFPPPFKESAINLSLFIKQPVFYLKEGFLSKDMLKRDIPNYLLVNDQCDSIRLRDIQTGQKIFSNNTWAVFSLAAATGYQGIFVERFSENFVEKIKTFFKEWH